MAQIAKLPKEFRMAGDEVRIRKHGATVILEPIARDWRWLDDVAGKFSGASSRRAATNRRCRGAATWARPSSRALSLDRHHRGPQSRDKRLLAHHGAGVAAAAGEALAVEVF